jgi:hypothetical protein
MRLWFRQGLLVILVLGGTGCGVLSPSCMDEDGPVLNSSGVVRAGDIVVVSVRSPKSSNLILRLHWSEHDPRLGLRATITDCGGHVGCAMLTLAPSFGPGGPSPIPQPWPSGFVEMPVDGWAGKTYLVEVIGAADVDVAYTLDVSYHIACES